MSRSRSVLAGLIGVGIGGSRSPVIHEEEAAALGVPMVYRIIDGAVCGFGADDLGELLTWVEHLGYDGLNVTHPFKMAIIPHLDSLSDAAQALGAVNTVVLRDGKRHGDNTDWSGYRRSFVEGLGDRARDRVAMIGAGGAAAAVGYAHLTLGARDLAIHDPDGERVTALVKRLGDLFPQARVHVAPDAETALHGADGVAQVSPVGMQGHPGMPFDPDLLLPTQWVSEVIYFPLRTALLEAAAARGCATLDGGGMAVGQAADALRQFVGQEPELTRMLAAFHRHSESLGA